MEKNAKNKKEKPIFLHNGEAIRLIHQRAKDENRSYSNALTTTVIESLKKPSNQAEA